MNWNYIGGFFDGEGTVGIGGSTLMSLTIDVAQKYPGVLKIIQNFVRIPSTLRYVESKGYWHLRYTGIRAADFAKKLVNYTIIKRQQLLHAIEWFDSDKETRAIHYDEIKRLKRVEAVLEVPNEQMCDCPWDGKMRFKPGQRHPT